MECLSLLSLLMQRPICIINDVDTNVVENTNDLCVMITTDVSKIRQNTVVLLSCMTAPPASEHHHILFHRKTHEGLQTIVFLPLELQQHLHMPTIRQHFLRMMCNLHTPFSRILRGNTSELDGQKGDIVPYLTMKISTSTTYVQPSTANTKLYSGFVLCNGLPSLHPEFIVSASALDATKDYTYTYELLGLFVYTKRPINLIMSCLEQLQSLQTVVLCNHVSSPNTSLLRSLQSLMIPYTLVQSSSYVPRSKTLVIKDDICISNVQTLLQYLRKCPSFSTFDMLWLSQPNGSVTYHQACNELFSVIKPTSTEIGANITLLSRANADFPTILVPYMYVDVLSSKTTSAFSATSTPRSKYFIPSLGSTKLEEQMTNYSAVARSFDVYTDHQRHNHIQLSSIFENTPYTVQKAFQNTFEACMTPQPYPFMFTSEVQQQAFNYLSSLRGDAQHTRIIGVIREDASESEKRAQEIVLSSMTGTVVYDTDTNVTKGILLAIFANTDTLICSSSTFSFWAAMMNSSANHIPSTMPEKYIQLLSSSSSSSSSSVFEVSDSSSTST